MTSPEYSYIRGANQVAEVLRDNSYGSLLGLDLETYARKGYDSKVYGLFAKTAKIRTAQFSDGERVVILDFMEEDGTYSLLNRDLAFLLYEFLTSRNLVGHNAVFDTSILQYLFLIHKFPYKPLDMLCTMIMYRFLCFVEDDWLVTSSSLKDVAQKVLDLDISKQEQFSDWSSSTLTEKQLNYCALDAVLPLWLKDKLLPKIKYYEMGKALRVNIQAQEAVAMMMYSGCIIDKEKHSRIIKEWEAKVEESHDICVDLLNNHVKSMSEDMCILHLMRGIDGQFRDEGIKEIELFIDKSSVNEVGFYFDLKAHLEAKIEKHNTAWKKTKTRPFPVGLRVVFKKIIQNIDLLLVNPLSSQQLSNWLIKNLSKEDLRDWETTETGKALKTDSDTLEQNSHIELIKPLLEYKKYKTALSRYGTGLLEYIHEVNGEHLVFPSYTLGKTATGRMSSFSPNLQNQPRIPEYRSIWVAPEGDYSLLCADYSQMELRVAALVSGDETMLNAYEQGKDLHKITASNMAGIREEEVTKEHRQAAKACNFGLLYGAGAKTLRLYAKKTYGVNMSLNEAYNACNMFKETYPDYYDWQIKQSEDSLESLVVRTPLGKLRTVDYQGYYTRSMNTPIQGGSAEIMLIAITKITHALRERELDSRLINVVHDEVIVWSHNDCLEEVKEIIKSSMENALLEVFPDACLRDLVDVGIGQNWTEAK